MKSILLLILLAICLKVLN